MVVVARAGGAWWWCVVVVRGGALWCVVMRGGSTINFLAGLNVESIGTDTADLRMLEEHLEDTDCIPFAHRDFQRMAA